MIRTASRDDEGALLELIAEFYEIDGHPFVFETVRTGLGPLLDSDRYGMVLVADDGDGVIGYAAVVWSYSIESGGPDALLDEIYVRRRGAGVGRRLMERIFEEVRARGMRRIFLETEPSNERGRSFYRRLGFEVEDSVWMLADIGLGT